MLWKFIGGDIQARIGKNTTWHTPLEQMKTEIVLDYHFRHGRCPFWENLKMFHLQTLGLMYKQWIEEGKKPEENISEFKTELGSRVKEGVGKRNFYWQLRGGI